MGKMLPNETAGGRGRHAPARQTPLIKPYSSKNRGGRRLRCQGKNGANSRTHGTVGNTEEEAKKKGGWN